MFDKNSILFEKSTLSTKFYGIFALALYLVTLISYILQLRSILLTIEQVKEFYIELTISICLTFTSIIFACYFIRFVFKRTQNLANDNLKLGHDLTPIDLPTSTTLSRLRLIKIYSLPTFNTICHTLMCVTIYFAKLLLVQKLNELNLILLSDSVSQTDLWFYAKFNGNIDYVNCIFALLVLTYKYVQVTVYINAVYTFLMFANIALFLLINAISLKFMENVLLFDTNKTVDLNFLLNFFTTAANNQTIENTPQPTNVMVKNFSLIFVLYLAYYLLVILYLCIFNMYILYHYAKEQLKLKIKFENIYQTVDISTASTSTSFVSGKPSGSVMALLLTQYNLIIMAIVCFILLQLVQVPFLFKLYELKCVGVICLILVSFLYNIILLIILSAKTRWSIRFTFKYRIYAWYMLHNNNNGSNGNGSVVGGVKPKILVRDEMLNSSFNTKLSQTSDYSTTNMTYISQQSGQLLQPAVPSQQQQQAKSSSSSTASTKSSSNTTTTGLIMKQINENINNYIKYDCPTGTTATAMNNKKFNVKQQQQFIDAYDFTNSSELLSYPLYASSSTTSSSTSH